jgi:hypothetical protein
MNEVEVKLAQANAARDRILLPFYKDCSRDGNVVFLDGDTLLAKILQRTIQADTLINRYSGSLLAIQEKIRFNAWQRDDILVEVNAWTVPHETDGWLYTVSSAVEVVLYASVHGDGNGATCFPLPWPATRLWMLQHKTEFAEQMARNPINGFEHWTRNLVVPRRRITEALRFEGFNLREGKIVQDFFSTPRPDWIA